MSQHVMSEIDSDVHILEKRLKGHVDNGMQSVLEIAQNISECCQDDENLKKAARSMMTDYIAMEKEIKQQILALDQIKKMSLQQEIPDLIECLDENLAELNTRNRADPKAHPKYKEMETRMIANDNMISDEEFNSLRATLLGSTEEDEVALTQTEVNTKCPYSGLMMVNPVRNSVCGHVYDRDPILEHIKARKGRAKCPVGGCTNPSPMNAKMLEEHTDLKRYIDYINKGKASSSG